MRSRLELSKCRKSVCACRITSCMAVCSLDKNNAKMKRWRKIFSEHACVTPALKIASLYIVRETKHCVASYSKQWRSYRISSRPLKLPVIFLILFSFSRGRGEDGDLLFLGTRTDVETGPPFRLGALGQFNVVRRQQHDGTTRVILRSKLFHLIQ